MPTIALKRAHPVYKYRELMEALGSDQDIRELFMAQGFDAPTLPVIKGWRMRNSIPTKWLPLLMHQALKDGTLPDLSRLLKEPF